MLDHNIIADWTDPNPVGIGILAVSTGWGAVGEWEFANLMGKQLPMLSPDSVY